MHGSALATSAVLCRFVYEGQEGYTSAPITRFPFPMAPRVIPNALWTDHRNNLLVNFPVNIPQELWKPEAQKVQKTWKLVYALKLEDIGPNQVRMTQIMWADILVGKISETLHKGYYQAVDRRLRKHLKQHAQKYSKDAKPDPTRASEYATA